MKTKDEWTFEKTGRFANSKEYGGSDLVILRSYADEDDEEDGMGEDLYEIKPLLVKYDSKKKLEVVKVSKYDLDRAMDDIGDDTTFGFVFSQDRVKFVDTTKLVPADVDEYETCVYFVPDET